MRAQRVGEPTTSKRSVLALIFLVAGLVVFLVSGASVASARVRTPIIHVLSNRADLISGGGVLVSVDLTARTNSRRVRVYLNGHPITSNFAVRPNGRFQGRVTGLLDGQNTH